MQTSRVRDLLLTLFGVLALIVYVLACRPAFSPDGSKLALPIMDAKNKITTIAVYDLRARSMDTVFVSSPAAKEEDRAYSVQWLPDGKRLVIDGTSTIMIAPFGASHPIRLLSLDEKLPADSLALPPPIIGNYQYLLGKTSVEEKNNDGKTVSVDRSVILRVNLDTLEFRRSRIAIEGNLIGNGHQLYYLGKPENADNDQFELGVIDTDKLTAIRFLELSKQEYGELPGYMAINKAGNRLAIVAEVDDTQRIILVRDNAIEKRLLVPSNTGTLKLGNLEWSQDQKTLFAAFSRDLSTGDLRQYGVLEIPLDGGTVREIALFNGKAVKDNDLIFIQIALSPAGDRLATASACLGEEDGVQAADRALYLLDLGDAKRQVTKIAIPLPSTPPAAAASSSYR